MVGSVQRVPLSGMTIRVAVETTVVGMSVNGAYRRPAVCEIRLDVLGMKS